MLTKLLGVLELQEKCLKDLKKYEPVVIYTMGKVASTSIARSFVDAGYGNIFHTHELRDGYKDILSSLKRKNLRPSYLWIEESIFLHENKTPLNKIVTLVRDPIARNISAYFENSNIFFQDKLNNIEVSINKFIKEYHHNIPISWFDVKFRKSLGIDVFDYDFDHKKGYQIIKTNALEILIMKVELEDEVKEEALREFMSDDAIKLVAANKAGDKKYYEYYKDFISAVCLTDDYINSMYNSKYMKHFYSDDEISVLKLKWKSCG